MAQKQLFISEEIVVVATCFGPKQALAYRDGRRCTCQLVSIQLLSFAEERFDRRTTWWKGIAEPPADWLPSFTGPEVLYTGPCDCLPFRFSGLRKQIHEIAHQTLQQWFSEDN